MAVRLRRLGGPPCDLLRGLGSSKRVPLGFRGIGSVLCSWGFGFGFRAQTLEWRVLMMWSGGGGGGGGGGVFIIPKPLKP